MNNELDGKTMKEFATLRAKPPTSTKIKKHPEQNDVSSTENLILKIIKIV